MAGRELRSIIIGAGMAGLLAAIRLKARGETDFTIYEKGDKVGGTWRENTYPGLACDTPAHSYTYSFAYNPDWSAYYAPGPEIREYFERVAREHGILEHIRFNTEVESAEWKDGQWHVRTRDGTEDHAEVLVAATGVLHHPLIADIPGLDTFERPWFHSARWDHSIPLDGKRIGVIGSGSTGVQIIAALSTRAGRLVHFQRTAQWIMPCPATKYSAEERRAFRENPALIDEVRSGPDAAARRARFQSAIIDANSPQLLEIQDIVERNLDESVKDPALKAKLTPNYRAACKRMIFSPDYYAAIQRPGVYLENGEIDRIMPKGVQMKDGTFHELDLLVMATGFRVDQFVRPMKVFGEDGLALDDFWAKGPRAYYAVTVPGFPNMVLLNGPTGPVGNFSLIDVAELQWNYFDQLLDRVRSGSATGVSPTLAALERYESERNEAARKTVFASGCKSWYLDANGIPQVWPWSWAHFTQVMEHPCLEDYHINTA
ncbi:flavin-containing monooxygenase [Novosphingobium malaysiense]|uniref:Monooxygenase n=1 Tax=Novosphingobium malaysiense TaxID=1348853 RepID=A0A0B1ZLN2_9SPHN|nr:NAD(P)/FAD-dependent oxidoreductase [Novosphingobium malaysiense]KHK90175.1 monooxygenase [Novosphingobium malaysiense]